MPLLIRRIPRQALADHQLVNVLGAFVRLHRFEIAHVPHDRAFVHDAVVKWIRAPLGCPPQCYGTAEQGASAAGVRGI
jgi:hypothetical protein